MFQGLFRDETQARIEQVIHDRLYNPGFYPPVSEFAIGYDASVWLRGPALPDRQVVRWTVLGPDGEVRRRVDLPRGFRAMDANEGQAWGSEFDDLGVPYIVSQRDNWSGTSQPPTPP